MIDMQKQVLEEADWKNKELRAQLASLDLLCGEEIQKRQMLAEQLSQVKEQAGVSQVYTCSASGTTLCCYIPTVTYP